MDDVGLKVQKALRLALRSDADLTALVGFRIVDEPHDKETLPLLRFGRITPVPDDTDGTAGWLVSVGLEAHSRPEAARPDAGRVEAGRICGAIHAALHRQPEALTVEGWSVIDIEVQSWLVDRQSDGAAYLGTLALEISLG